MTKLSLFILANERPRSFHLCLTSLLLFVFCISINAQNTITVSGKVTDKSNAPIPGVSVIVQNSNTGASTDFDGNYTIKAPSNAILEFRYLGYVTQKIAINGRSSITVEMEEDSQQLEEIVVIGYGTQRKEAVTGSVASISGEVVRDVPASNVTESLQGRLPGIDISRTSSRPGATRQIRIRGVRSLSASNDPLIVLNGITFSGSIADISPSSIKSVDVLKDASATAIYGSRGANGVILITTKKGVSGQKAKISYNGFTGVQSVFAQIPMMSGPELVKLRSIAQIYGNNDQYEDDNTDTNWQDLNYQAGTITSHDIDVSGGGESSSYNFGLAYLKEEAAVPLLDYERFSLRTTLNQQIGEHIKIGFSTNTNYSISNNGFGLGTILSLSPLASPYDSEGNFQRSIEMETDSYWTYTRESVNALGDTYVNQNKGFGTYNSFFGELSIPGVKGLKYRMNIGLNYSSNFSPSFRGVGVLNVNENERSSASVNRSHSTRYLIENLLTYDKTFNDKHSINVVGLYSFEKNEYFQSRSSATNIANDVFQYHALELNNDGVLGVQSEYRDSGLKSVMGRVMYSYDNKYMISATLRTDGSSRLADGHQWHTYPAVSAGWNIHNESFADSLEWLSSLKLRAGYGETSNQAVREYATLGRLESRPYNFGDDTYLNGYHVSELPNPGLGWEFSQTLNLGLDFSLLNNRLSGTIEYYKTDTNDLLLRRGLPATSGVSGYFANIGKTQNKGVEFSLNGIILDNPDGFSWEASLNLYANRNKLVALDSGQDRNEGNWWFVGHPINVIYDYEKTGIWQETDPYRDILEPGGNAGMIKVKYTGEYNADGTPVRAINADDRQIIDTNPDFQGGFSTRFSYKNIDLNFVGTFQSGGVVSSLLYGSGGYLNLLTGRRNNVRVNYWTPDNPGGTYPLPGGIQSSDNPKYGSTLSYFDGTYLKIRTITLGYNLSNEIAEKLNLDKLRIYTTVTNPFVFFSDFHSQSGMDPEPNGRLSDGVGGGGGSNRILTIGAGAPSTRNFMFGLNLTF